MGVSGRCKGKVRVHTSNAAHTPADATQAASVCAAQPKPEPKPELEPMTPRTAHPTLPAANHFVKFAPEDIPYAKKRASSLPTFAPAHAARREGGCGCTRAAG